MKITRIRNPEDIRKARRQLRLNQAELAELLGVSQAMISRYESGNSTLPPMLEQKILEHLREQRFKDRTASGDEPDHIATVDALIQSIPAKRALGKFLCEHLLSTPEALGTEFASLATRLRTIKNRFADGTDLLTLAHTQTPFDVEDLGPRHLHILRQPQIDTTTYRLEIHDPLNNNVEHWLQLHWDVFGQQFDRLRVVKTSPSWNPKDIRHAVAISHLRHWAYAQIVADRFFVHQDPELQY